jgi:hypothetical protein
MTERLPPAVAALLPDGEHLVVGDLTLADVRRVLAAVDRCLRFVATAAPGDVALVRQALANDDIASFHAVLKRQEDLAGAARGVSAESDGPHG